MKKALQFIWGLFKNNRVLKIMAVLFAVVLWSYVLAGTDPLREKVLSNVPVDIQFEQLANGLAVSQSLSDQLKVANVRVDVKQSYAKQLTNASVSLKVDLSQISRPGEYELPISYTGNNANCQILGVSPVKVKLVIDYKVTTPIPVDLQVTGTVADGYWVSEPTALPANTVEISGAAVDVDKASSAVCNIDVSGLKEWNTKSMEVTILDSDGNPLDPDLFGGSLPSVIVDMSILPKKTVPVDAAGSITGQDSIASGYEITGIECNPATVEIVGAAEDLAKVSSIALVPYPVSNASGDVEVPLDFAPPEGVTVLAEGKAQVTVTIREKTSTETYKSVGIEIRNLGGGLNAKLELAEVDVTVLAGISKMSRLRASDVVPYVDLNGLGIGTHTVDIKFEIPEGFVPENFSATKTVTVTIARG